MIKRIYFLNIKLQTGGPENIHQVCSTLKKNGYDAKIFYGDGILKHPDKFQKYENDAVSEVIVDDETLFVFPEFLEARRFKNLKCKKALWWLSIDNSPDRMQQDLAGYLKDCGVNYCFAQCKYAYDYLTSRGVENVYMVPDYVNVDYLQKERSQQKRNPWILFNPKKGIEFTAKIIEKCKDLTFVPIQNMTNEEVLNLMDKSMIYIDFGNHPGKDRIPREAAMRDLVVIVGKKGSAANDVDVPLPADLKFDVAESQLDAISEKLHQCIRDYSSEHARLEKYKQMVRDELQTFECNVISTFEKICA